jgi:hypothetical protein
MSTAMSEITVNGPIATTTGAEKSMAAAADTAATMAVEQAGKVLIMRVTEGEHATQLRGARTRHAAK